MRDYVTIQSPVIPDKLLFEVERHGTAVHGSTLVNLSLSEINPPLARDIANLEQALANQRQVLIDNASKVTDLAAKLDALQRLETDLADLTTRSLEEISLTDLDAILASYADVIGPATRAVLTQLLTDLKRASSIFAMSSRGCSTR